MNELVRVHGYGLTMLLGALLIISFFLVREAVLIWAGFGLVILGVVGDRLKVFKAGATGVEFELFKVSALRGAAKKIAKLKPQTGYADAQGRFKVTSAEQIRIKEDARVEVLGEVAEALNASTPEEFGDRLADIVITPDPARLTLTTHPPTVSTSDPSAPPRGEPRT
jgi:hypothetical protein